MPPAGGSLLGFLLENQQLRVGTDETSAAWKCRDGPRAHSVVRDGTSRNVSRGPQPQDDAHDARYEMVAECDLDGSHHEREGPVGSHYLSFGKGERLPTLECDDGWARGALRPSADDHPLSDTGWIPEDYVVKDAVMVRPHVLDFDVRSGLISATFPKLLHDCGIDFAFLPLFAMVDASAASVDDDDAMLCSTLGELNTETGEVTIR